MLITIFQKRHGKFIPIDQYYRWNLPGSEETVDPAVVCPGCGKNTTRLRVNNSHQCTGTLTDYPIITGKFDPNKRWKPKSAEGPYTIEQLDAMYKPPEKTKNLDIRIEEYIEANKHRITVGE